MLLMMSNGEGVDDDEGADDDLAEDTDEDDTRRE